MSAPLHVMLVSRSADALRALDAALAGCGDVRKSVRLMSNGHTDPLHGVTTLPDVVVLRFDDAHLGELATLADMDPARRPPLVLVGPLGNAEAMRLAVRCGARDFLAEPVAGAELAAALDRLRGEIRRERTRPLGSLVALVGAAGGVGTSFLACNLAHMLAREGAATCLLDLDHQYGTLAAFLDLPPRGLGLAAAIEAAETLDATALQGYVCRHPSGLDLLTSSQDTVASLATLAPDRMALVTQALLQNYRYVVADVPHLLDPAAAAVVGMASHVFVVVQQSVAHVRNAARLTRLLNGELGLPADRVRIVVNRHAKGAGVSAEDVAQALKREPILVPNHYKPARESIDTGVPLLDVEGGSALARAVQSVRAVIAGEAPEQKPGFFRRALPIFSRNKT